MKHRTVLVCASLAVAFCALSSVAQQQEKPPQGAAGRGVVAGVVERKSVLPPKRQLPVEYGKLALSFEANQGQTDSPVKFLSRGPGYGLFLTPSEAVLMLRRPADERTWPMKDLVKPLMLWPEATVLRMKLVRANPTPKIDGLDELPGRSNFFIGNDPKNWRTNVSNYARVRYREVYPGVDLVYHGNQRQLEQDFIIAPGADPAAITLRFDGVDKLSLGARGDLVLRTEAGELRFEKPMACQQVEGGVKEVRVGYALKGSNEVGFQVGPYDASRPLIIDPVLAYSTSFGGSSGFDRGGGIAVDSSGNAYVTGWTGSTDFPTANPIQPANGGGTDAFVAKLNAAGNALVYSTYLGGSGDDQGFGIAVDSSGNAYVTGRTNSTNFPTAGAIQVALGGGFDAFVTKLNAAGNALVYSTYLGGSSDDQGVGIAMDSSGNAYVAGSTNSTNFPTATPFQPAFGGTVGFLFRCGDAFVTKLNAAGNALVYSTYLGGSSDECANGIAVDSSGNAYVTGETISTNFPTANAIQPANAGGLDAFVTKLNATGNALVYSTYFGGGSADEGQSIAVDPTGNAYVAGSTNSTNFPTATPFQPTFGGVADAFVTKFNAAGSALVYSTYLGGSDLDIGRSIVVDSSGNAYVTGFTYSNNFPTANPIQPKFSSPVSAFVTKLNAAGRALVYSTYLGGGSGTVSGSDGIAVDSFGSAYMVGGLPSTLILGPPFGGGVSVAKIDTLMVYAFQGTASGNFRDSNGIVTTFALAPFTITATADPGGIFQFTQPCNVPSGLCAVFAVQATSAKISVQVTGSQLLTATFASPVGVFDNQTWQTLGFTRIAAGAVNSDLMDLQSNAAFAAYGLANAVGPVGPFFPTAITLGQFNCSFGCVTTDLGTLTVSSVQNVMFAAQ